MNVSTQDEACLVAAAQRGHLPAFAELYDRYAGLIRAVCHDTTGELHAAQDLAQEAFLRAYRNLHRLRQPDRFGSWLDTIARHVCREWRRTRRRDRLRFRSDALHEPVDVGEVDGQVVRDEALDTIHQAIAGLPKRERLALHLFYLDERSAEHARSLMGLSRPGFYRTLERARDRPRKALHNHKELRP